MAPNCPDPPHRPAVSGQDDQDVSFLGGGGAERTVMVQAPTELGPYRLTKLLGRGGMGEVWQAFDTKLERDVAVKLMRKELLANEEAVKRFAREARAVARLNHPNIVQVYTFGDEQGVLYFVMELVEGETITQRMKQCGTVPLGECVFMLLQAIEGLSYANARGIIHRDIKPSNLMLTPDFRIKIADFGLAKMIEHDTQMTAAGTTMGSPNYMSPEQARGEEADHRSDIYALGISFYQMLTGSLPFTAEQPITVLLKQIQEPLPEPVMLQALENGRALEVLKKMTQKDPEQRYQTYGGLAAAISALAPDVRVKGSHIATTTMPTPGSPGVPSSSSSVAPNSAAVEPPLLPAAVPTEPMAAAGEPALHGGPEMPPPPPPPPTTQSSEIRTQNYSQAPLPQAPPPPRPAHTNFFMIAAAAGTAAVVALGALFAFNHLQQRRNNGEPRSYSEAAPAPAQTAAVSTSTPDGPAPTVSVASPSPVVSPVPSATPANSPAPTPSASPTAVARPTQIPDVARPVATVASIPPVFTPTPTPTPVVFANSQVIAGGVGVAPNTPVDLRNAQGAVIARVPAGTLVPLVRLEGAGAAARYLVSYQGQQAYLAFNDAQAQLAGTSPVTTPGTVPAFVTLVLGTGKGGPGEKVDVYRDTSLHPLVSLPAGTEVTQLETSNVMIRVQLPDGKQGYILKGSATVKR
jgi:serine/threonine protein kinase